MRGDSAYIRFHFIHALPHDLSRTHAGFRRNLRGRKPTCSIFRLFACEPDGVVGDAEAGGDQGGGGGDEPADLGLAEGHAAQGRHARGQAYDVDGGAHRVGEDRRVSGPLGRVFGHGIAVCHGVIHPFRRFLG